MMIYGVTGFVEERMRYVYERHDREVRRMMATDYRSRLLTIEMPGEFNWATICRFLGTPVPQIEFPWMNRRRDA